MNYVIIKQNKIIGIVKNIIITQELLDHYLNEGFEYREIPNNIKDEEFYKLENNQIILDQEAKNKAKELKDKAELYKKMPLTQDQLLALYYARHGDTSKLDEIDLQIADALK